MIFRQIKVGPMQNFCYTIGDEKSKDAAAIDSGWETNRIIGIARNDNLNITKIILTHSHYDHVQKVNELASKAKADVYFHKLENEELKKFGVNDAKLFSEGKEEVKVGSIKIKVIHTPGHTPGGICLLFENKLITGDTLFVNAIGRTDLPGGDAVKLFESLQKLKKLSDDTEVYPGHDYGDIPYSTIGTEKKNNPYFMCESKEQFLNLLGMF